MKRTKDTKSTDKQRANSEAEARRLANLKPFPPGVSGNPAGRPKSITLSDVLVRELQNFRVKINLETAHDSYAAWREGDHDDLVLAVCLALWAATSNRVTVTERERDLARRVAAALRA